MNGSLGSQDTEETSRGVPIVTVWIQGRKAEAPEAAAKRVQSATRRVSKARSRVSHPCLYYHTHPPRFPVDAPMATPLSLEAQVSNKWHHSFARLNRGEPGVSGLISFSEVRHSPPSVDLTHDRLATQAWRVATAFLCPRNLNDPTSHKNYSESALPLLSDG